MCVIDLLLYNNKPEIRTTSAQKNLIIQIMYVGYKKLLWTVDSQGVRIYQLSRYFVINLNF